MTERQKKEYSCTDCYIHACDPMGEEHTDPYPEFCLTKNMNPEVFNEAITKLHEPDNFILAKAGTEVEAEYYGRYCRAQEVMAFARKIGAKKLGIATCIGLLTESRTLKEVLEANGFQVYAVCCKCGSQKKADHGMIVDTSIVGPTMCNPILQAALLNEWKADLNILMGLCVGHDCLFYKHSEAPVTTLVCKDRVLGNNPVQALYLADSYYHDRLFPSDKAEKED